MSRPSIKRRYSKDEFAERGDAIYENDIRPQLQPDDAGKFAAIDIESGMYEVDENELVACDKLRVRVPEAQIWMVRVGSRYVHRFGGRTARWRKLRVARFLVPCPAGAKQHSPG